MARVIFSHLILLLMASSVLFWPVSATAEAQEQAELLRLALKPIEGIDEAETPKPKQKPKRKPKSKKRPQARLTVRTEPAGARVRIMNIKPSYRAGMTLSTGRYDFKVSKSGYRTYRRWHTLKAGKQVLTIKLKQKPVRTIKPKQKPVEVRVTRPRQTYEPEQRTGDYP